MTDENKRLLDEARALDAAATPGPWGDDDGNVFCRPLAAARHEACVAKVEGRPYEADHLAFDAFVCTTEQRHPESDADATFIARARTLMMELAVALEASERERDHADVRLAGVEEERDHYRQALAASKWCDKHAVAQPCQFCPDERIVKRLEEETTLRSNLQQQLAVAESALDWHKREASRFAALVTQEHAKRIDVERERDSALAALAKAQPVIVAARYQAAMDEAYRREPAAAGCYGHACEYTESASRAHDAAPEGTPATQTEMRKP